MWLSRQSLLLLLVGIVLPLVSALVTYTFVSSNTDALWTLDETQSLILTIALVKLVVLGSVAGVLPIDVGNLFDNIKSSLGRKKRDIPDIPSINAIDNTMSYQVPEVHLFPCARRFICELETVVKTSENYLPQGPAIDYDRIIEEEEAPEEVDPMKEMHVEAIRALFRDEDPTGEINLRSKRALGVVDGLTGGKSCEEAYKQCPGRFSAPMVFRAIFDEFNMEVHDEL